MKHILIILVVFFLAAPLGQAADSALVLADILAGKGLISSEQRDQVERAGPQGGARLLASMLLNKGLLSPAEAAAIGGPVDESAWSNAGIAAEPTSRVRILDASLVRPPQAPAPAKSGAETAPAVTSQSKLPVTLYGTILLNSFYNTGPANIEDVPLLAAKRGSDTLGNFGMTARQSRLGLRFSGSEVAGGKLSGQAEIDLFAGKTALPNGINMDVVRLRLAFARLDWKRFSLVGGQDWSVFAPLNPTSLAGFSIPDLAGAGNPWIRTPQIRAELRADLNNALRLQWQIAVADPNLGDNPSAFQTVRTPGIGEHGQMPALETRLAFLGKIAGQDAGVGFSSHYNRGKNVGTIAGVTVNRAVDSWGVALDYTLPFCKDFNVTGEIFEGRALGIFSVGLGQSVLPVGTPGEHGVEERGGWLQAQFNLSPRWQANAAYGIDLPNASELRLGDRSRNQSYLGNLLFKASPRVTLAWEWRRFLTQYRNQAAANNTTDHANMAVSYTF